MTRFRYRPAGPAVLAVVAVLLSGCAIGPSARPALATSGAAGSVAVPTTAAATRPVGPGGPGRTAEPIQWSGCADGIDTRDPATDRQFTLQCAEVEVPKSYTDAASGTFAVSVAKATTAATPSKAPTLAVLLDGPGANGTHRAATVAGSLPTEITDHFAVVVMDLRGTGDSVPIDCVSGHNSADLLSLGADPSTSVASNLLAELSRSLTFDCGDMVGPDLSDYSTQLAADDQDTVRAAIGQDTISVLGRGFGATLGAVYADRYPGRTAAAVLDGPTDPLLTPDKRAAASAVAYETALTSFAQACPTFTGGCPLGSDPAGAIRSLVKSLGDIGIPTSDGRTVTGGSVLLALVDELGRPAGWPALAAALSAATKDDVDGLSQLLLTDLGQDSVEEHQAGNLVYQCNDSTQRLGGTALTTAANASAADAPVFGPFLTSLIGVCSSWPAPETPLGAIKATGAPPLLLLGAVLDPVSPLAHVRSLAVQLDSATLLTWQSGTHGSYPTSSCMSKAVDAYLLSGTVPAAGTLCPP